MAKVAFSKLGIKKVDDSTNTIFFDQIAIEVKHYLPIQDKLTIIGNAINMAADENRFPNWMKIKMCLSLEIVYAYTNLIFTDKQKEDPAKLYDMIYSSGLLDNIINNIAQNDIDVLMNGAKQIAEAMYAQMNSLYGIMENIATDYANVDMDANNIQEKLANPENLALLKNVMTKLG